MSTDDIDDTGLEVEGIGDTALDIEDVVEMCCSSLRVIMRALKSGFSGRLMIGSVSIAVSVIIIFIFQTYASLYNSTQNAPESLTASYLRSTSYTVSL